MYIWPAAWPEPTIKSERTPKQKDFDARVTAFMADIRALEDKHGLRLEAGYGPYGEDLGVKDANDDELCANLG